MEPLLEGSSERGDRLSSRDRCRAWQEEADALLCELERLLQADRLLARRYLGEKSLLFSDTRDGLSNCADAVWILARLYEEAIVGDWEALRDLVGDGDGGSGGRLIRDRSLQRQADGYQRPASGCVHTAA